MKRKTKTEFVPLREGVDYSFDYDGTLSRIPAVRLISHEKWSGIVFKYTDVQFIEDYELDCVRLKFEYVLIEPTTIVEDIDEFEHYIGRVLHSILDPH